MADPVAEPAAPPAKGKGKGKKVLGLPVPVAIGIAAALAAFGYIWWRDRHGSSSGAASSSTAASTATSGTDYSSELAELQSEIDQLTGAAGGSGGGVVGTTPVTGTSTKTTTSTKTGSATRPHTPGGESAGGITDTSATVRWTSVASATSYHVRVWEATGSHPVIHDASEKTTAQSVSGLRKKTKYGWHVAAVNSAGSSAFCPDQHFETK